MSVVIVLWTAAATAALTLGAIHLLVWLSDRGARANLAFAIVAVAFTCMAPLELQLMHARTPEEYGLWVRWIHVPVFTGLAGTVLFVRLYLGTGRSWLAALIIGLRCAVLVANFAFDPNFSFDEISSLRHVTFLGEEVTTVGQAVVGSWQWLAVTSLVLFILFVLDATVTLWRQGDHEARRKAGVVGGGIFLCFAIAILPTQLTIYGISRGPILMSPPFLIAVIAMALELSRDLLRAARLARELAESRRQLELTTSAAGLGVWVWDIARRELKSTGKARELHGILYEQAVDLARYVEPIHREDVAGLRRDVQRALASGTEFLSEYRVCLPGGAVRWIAARGRAEFDASGNPTVIRGVVRDISDRRRAQAETEELRRELAHAGRVTMLGQLSAALAHELNQPLGAILRNAEAASMMLESPAVDVAELRAIVADIRKDDQRAGEVIDRLRALLRRQGMELLPVAFDGLVQDVNALVRADAASRHVTLDLAVEAGLPLVLGDRVHLLQVLLNLVINGMDAAGASPEGGRKVAVKAQRGQNGMIEVAVIDSGPGVVPELAPRLFDPFFTTKMHGMGMGLPISRTIVEAHGGKLWLDPEATPGATFRFTLRAAESGSP